MDNSKKHMKIMLKGTSRSFYLTLKFLPRKIRDQISLMYLLARLSDTIADSNIEDKEQLIELLGLYNDRIQTAKGVLPDFTDLSYQQNNLAERNLLLNAEVPIGALEKSTIFKMSDREKIRECLRIIINGQTLDLERFTGESEKSIIAIASEEELDEYTYMVAGCVGEFWTHMSLNHLFDLNEENRERFFEKAINFGKALQLINILRDIPDDLRMGRCYIPHESLSDHGLIVEDLLDMRNMNKFRPLYESYVIKAEHYLSDAIEYIKIIPNNQYMLRLSCMLPVLIGQRTLNLLRSENILDNENTIKVTRSEIKIILRKAIMASISRSRSLKLLKMNK